MSVQNSTEPPFRDAVIAEGNFFSAVWESFIRTIVDLVSHISFEQSFDLKNNQASAVAVDKMIFNRKAVSQAIVEFCVQRVTTGTGATELIESGVFIVSYRPTSDNWSIHFVNQNSPNDSGVTFTVNASGQVLYTSTNITGTASISRVFWRSRTLAGKSAKYSNLGGR